MTAALTEHEPFCLPRPGHDEPRTERYMHTVDSEDPASPPRRVLVHRCCECGVAHYTEG